MAETRIYVGTAGWSYPDWENIVYPRGPSADRLGIVAGHLDCVEVDSSFYRPPTPRVTETWLRRVAERPDFRFLAKAWQRFTHERSARWTRSEYELFADGLAPLREAGRLDALLFQFPWSFRNDTGNRDWLAGIADDFAGWPVAVEVRHDSWLQEEGLEVLRQRNMTFCNIDQPRLSHCLPPTAHVTAGFGYYRLHGRNTTNWFREKQDVYGGRYDYLYSEAELDELLVPIRQVAARSKKMFVVFNNHKDAKAFANALQLKIRLAPSETVQAPATLVDRFPGLRGAVTVAAAPQLPLL